MDSRDRNKVKLLAAVIGGSAVVTLGALATSIHQEPTGTADVAAGKMTMGATSTETVVPAAVDNLIEATTMAVPAIKGPAPLPPEEKAAE